MSRRRATLEGRNKILGFWLFLGGETVLFGTLFSAFLALRHQVLDGNRQRNELFELAARSCIATFILLNIKLDECVRDPSDASNKVKAMIIWLIVTDRSWSWVPWT